MREEQQKQRKPEEQERPGPPPDVKPGPPPKPKSPQLSDHIKPGEKITRERALPPIRTGDDVSDDEPHIKVGDRKASMGTLIAIEG